MKKYLLFTLFLLSMCNVSLLGMCQDVLLEEVYLIMPLDDNLGETSPTSPDPTQFCASICDNQLYVGAYTDALAHVEVIHQESGEVILGETFEGEIYLDVNDWGLFTIIIYSNYTAVQGEFVIE